MQKVTGDVAAIIAAILCQAEMAFRAGKIVAGESGAGGDSKLETAESYAHFYTVVTTGSAPEG